MSGHVTKDVRDTNNVGDGSSPSTITRTAPAAWLVVLTAASTGLRSDTEWTCVTPPPEFRRRSNNPLSDISKTHARLRGEYLPQVNPTDSSLSSLGTRHFGDGPRGHRNRRRARRLALKRSVVTKKETVAIHGLRAYRPHLGFEYKAALQRIKKLPPAAAAI